MPRNIDRISVATGGIHFQSLRYISTTLAAYVGETVMLRYDPRDMAEVRVFLRDRFLCRAVCPELAGTTVPLREILSSRNQRRRELRGVLRERQSTIDELLEIRRGKMAEEEDGQQEERETPPEKEKRRTEVLKRYRNE